MLAGGLDIAIGPVPRSLHHGLEDAAAAIAQFREQAGTVIVFRCVNEFPYRLNSGRGNGPRTIGQTVHNLTGKRLTWDRLTGKNDLYADVDLLNDEGPGDAQPAAQPA